MIQRFQIEDLVVQDSSGVVFRALDTETGKTVCLRRFFPFGPTGGGLNKDERAAYDIAVERLAGVSHPALRAVICGGCDPVDGMPFIATEWIDGNRLQSFIDNAPLAPAEAASLLNLALEVCQLLSDMLQEEAIWVETSLEAIVVGSEESRRGFTFWISPLKWLGQNEGQHGLESIVTLAEQVLGWEKQDISDQAGMGLGAWLNWLRASANTASLHEAREMLARSFGSDAPTPSKKLVLPAQSTRPVIIRRKKQSSGIFHFILGTVILLVIAGGGWALIRWRNPLNSLPSWVAEKTPPALDLPKIPDPPALPQPPSAPSPPGKILDCLKSRQLIMDQKGNRVIVEGILVGLTEPKPGEPLYLHFSKGPPGYEARGAIRAQNIGGELSRGKLLSLIGKKIHLSGKVEVEVKNKVTRPLVIIETRADIEVK